MKRLLAAFLCCVFLLSAVPVGAVSWAKENGDAGSPFALQIIKLAINSSPTGEKYYTVLNDAAAYEFSNVYFAIKAVLPSYSEANAYYASNEFAPGTKIEFSVKYINFDGWDGANDTVYANAYLSNERQTLWYNEKTRAFEPNWADAISGCGCGSAHIISGRASMAGSCSIKACVAVAGSLSNVRINDVYTVESKTFYGVKPCANCSPVNLSGFVINSDCSSNGVYFSVNKDDKVTGIYAFDNCNAYKTEYLGAVTELDIKLYRWTARAPKYWCPSDSCARLTYDLTELDKVGRQALRRDGAFTNPEAVNAASFAAYCDFYRVASDARDWNRVYYKDGLEYKPWRNLQSVFYYLLPEGYYSDYKTDSKYYLAYANNADTLLNYGNIYQRQSAVSDARLFKMTSATTVECDYTEKGFLNSINAVLGVLGFSYDDVAAGNIYMNKAQFLSNYGVNLNGCVTSTWQKYNETITVAPIPEVPATGDASCASLLALSGAAFLALLYFKRKRSV